MTTFYNNTKANIDFLSTLTGIPRIVCDAWMRCEGQDSSQHSPTNPLNIQYFGSARPLQIGSHGVTAVYGDVETGLRDAWGVLHLPYYERVREAIRTGDPFKISNAIEKSPWAGSHYGSTAHVFASGCISNRIRYLQKNDPKYRPTGKTKPIKVKVKIVATGNPKVDKQVTAVHDNLQYINNKLAADLDTEQQKEYQEYVNKIMDETNELARLATT